VKRAIALSLFVVAVMATLFACEKREDFPPLLPIDPPPTPTNFQVTSPATLDYDLTWEIDDPDGLVQEYWIYLYSAITMPDTIDTTTDTFYFLTLPVELPELHFGVSAVTDQNVESDVVIKPAPPTPQP
jgi:hypothetical protein